MQMIQIDTGSDNFAEFSERPATFRPASLIRCQIAGDDVWRSGNQRADIPPAALLRRDPSLRVRQLAARLCVSERHLCRDFSAMFGMGPKQFARIARIDRVLAARARGAAWADIAYATGFTDQAHMINDFTAIVGVSPAELGHHLTRSRWLGFTPLPGRRSHLPLKEALS